MLAICLFVLSLSCQQSPLEEGIEYTETSISPVTINMPSLEQGQGHLFKWSDTDSVILLDKTADIFLFSEGLMELGTLSDERYFTELGHKVISSFYSHSGNYTSYTPERTHYVKIALGIKDVIIPEGHPREHEHDHNVPLEDAIAVQYAEPVRDAITYLQYKFDNSVGLELMNTDSTSDAIINRVLDFLNMISDSISLDILRPSIEIEDGAGNVLQINTDAIELADNAINEVTEAINTLRVRFMAIIGNDELTVIDRLESLKEIFEPLGIGGISEEIDRKKIFLEEAQRLDINANVNQWILQEIFDSTRSPLRQSLYSSLSLLVSKIDLNQLGDDFLNDPSLVEEGIAQALNDLLSERPDIIRDVVISSLESTISAENIYDSIHREATTQAEEMIFKGKERLPGIEFSHVQMVRDETGIVFSLDSDTGDSRVTNGVTLGTAMSVLAERLKQLETFEEDLYDEYNNHQLLFSLFNKSLSMVGHYIKDGPEGTIYEEVIPTSFFRPLVRQADQGRDASINIYNYNDLGNPKTQKGYFAIPDKIVLKENQAFTVDLEKTQEESMASSVLSQAELVRGASKILKYLRPDRPNSYDEDGGMGQLGILGNVLFPKLSFFNLHFGIAGVNLTNLKKAGIYVYEIEGSPIYMSEWDGEGALMASVHDIFEADSFIGAALDDVRTTDMARLMIAIEEFIPIFEGLDNDRIENISDTDRQNYKLVTDNLDTLRTLNLGLHFFITTRLQREDGCFVNSYNIKSQNVDDTIFLDTQVQAMLALTDFYRQSRELVEGDGPQGLALQGSILRAFNCLTEKLFDRQNGFYIAQEGTNQRPHLRLITDILRLLYKLDIVFADQINEGRELAGLRTQWTQAYISQLGPLRDALEAQANNQAIGPDNQAVGQSGSQVDGQTVTLLLPSSESEIVQSDDVDISISGQENAPTLSTNTHVEELFTRLEADRITFNFNKEGLLEAIELLNDGSNNSFNWLNELNIKLIELIIMSDLRRRRSEEIEERIIYIMELATTGCFREESPQEEKARLEQLKLDNLNDEVWATLAHRGNESRCITRSNIHEKAIRSAEHLFDLLENNSGITVQFDRESLLEAIELLNDGGYDGAQWLARLDRELKGLIKDISDDRNMLEKAIDWWNGLWQDRNTILERREQVILDIINLASNSL